MNNPLVYVDPSGKNPLIIIGIGMIIGAYIGGAAAEGWEVNPTKWQWDGDTWSGIGTGAVIGGLAGFGAYIVGPAMAGTGFFSHFGASGVLAAYSLTGAVAGGFAGYGIGFAGGYAI
ncbi:MAG: hypothetical protein B7C24_17670 [Bacteroidetes bacterium 4572_77]|nr:MAG: hypothetical protein B7C24_17670 [Bacteroidetes bacterium 4572_77]